MKIKMPAVLCVVLTVIFSGSLLAQPKKIENFDGEQKKYEKEVKIFLDAKLNDRNSTTIFSEFESNKAFAVNPAGIAHDSSSYKDAPRPLGDSVNLKTLRKDTIYSISIKTEPSSQKASIYNKGTVLIYNWSAIITSYVYGHLVSFKVTRLETYLKYKGKWMMVAGSGTEFKPKWMPTPVNSQIPN